MFVSPRVRDSDRPATVDKDNADQCSYISKLALQETVFFKPKDKRCVP